MDSTQFKNSPRPVPLQATNSHGMKVSELSDSRFRTGRSQLGDDFKPSNYSVVCGRGKDSFNHVGNRRFRIVASMFIERYSHTDSKIAKSTIVSEIIAVIHQAGGMFCKYKSGAWFEVGDHQAREKVSSLLRDLLHTQYRSSAKAKVGRRTTTRIAVKQKQKQDQNQLSCQKRVEEGDDSDDSSTTSACWGMSKDSLGFEYWLEDNFFDIDVF
jgi:hypothetical protein